LAQSWSAAAHNRFSSSASPLPFPLSFIAYI
jgi:hypothetical protein